MLAQAQPRPSKSALPLVVYILAAGTFLMGTTEFIIAGLLPEVARDLGVSISDAGLMITVFAIGMIVGAPLMAIATLRLPRRLTLGLALGVFAVGHVFLAASSNFALLLAARFVTALATGAFWSVAAVVAARAAGDAASVRAMGIVQAGGMLAVVLGVPLGAFAGQVMGWRGPFWALAVLAAISAAIVYRMVAPDDADQPLPSVRAELAGLRNPRVWWVLASCAIVCGSSLAAYSFISPLLTGNTGLASSMIPFVLVGYGLGAFAGSFLGGHFGSRRPYTVLFVSATMTFLVLAALCFFSHAPAATVVLIALLGLFGMSTNPILVSMAVRFAGQAPTLAAALTTSSFNLGTAIGSWIAGIALETSLGATGPVVVGTAIAALYFLPLGLLAAKERAAVPAPQESTPGGEPGSRAPLRPDAQSCA